jgi:hypothetical protein
MNNGASMSHTIYLQRNVMKRNAYTNKAPSTVREQNESRTRERTNFNS